MSSTSVNKVILLGNAGQIAVAQPGVWLETMNNSGREAELLSHVTAVLENDLRCKERNRSPP
jgi:hypothetical protein